MIKTTLQTLSGQKIRLRAHCFSGNFFTIKLTQTLA